MSKLLENGVSGNLPDLPRPEELTENADNLQRHVGYFHQRRHTNRLVATRRLCDEMMAAELPHNGAIPNALRTAENEWLGNDQELI
jgi:hypothetical protein